MSLKKKNIYIYLGKVILITLLIVLFIRCFFIESYSVSSSQMEDSLLKGDKILIDKTTYGIRLPITMLSIPFTFDNIFGVKSYSSVLQIPYKRLFENRVGRDDIVLFNNPQETDKPLDKRNLLLSRCIALPGDTIRMEDNLFIVNDKPYTLSPNLIEEYRIETTKKEETEDIIKKLKISAHNYHQVADTLFVELSRYDAFVLNENLPHQIKALHSDEGAIQSYQFQIPSKGKTIDLDESNIIVYQQIILHEQQGKTKIENGQLSINDVLQNKYTFEDDYYWVLSDNTTNSLDSRSLGFIPFRNIIGKARLIWYSSDENGTRSERCFLSVK